MPLLYGTKGDIMHGMDLIAWRGLSEERWKKHADGQFGRGAPAFRLHFARCRFGRIASPDGASVARPTGRRIAFGRLFL
jgi:hypothetical protein